MIVKVGRFIVHNWPLKVGAVLLASILYVGMVALQTNTTWPGTVAVDPINQPTNGYLVQPDPMPQVSNIRYIAPADVPISQSSFRATLDLANVKVSESQSWVRIQLLATDPRIQIVDYQPQQVRVELDPITRKTVNIQVVTGAVPSGLKPATPVLSVPTVEISGAASYVRRVAYAEARVSVPATGLDVDQNVDLIARDASDAVVNDVTIDPHIVRVQIQVGSEIRSETVPVRPNVIDSPAAGYYISSITVTPPVASIRGQADALAQLKGSVSTKSISVAGATSDVSVNVGLDLPTGLVSDVTTPIVVVVHVQAQTSTRTLTVGVVQQGARSDRVYVLSTLSVSVTLGGATAALNALDTSTLVATANVGEIGVGSSPVTITISVPPGIKVVAMTPSSIIVTVTIAASAAPPSPSP
ncbi:MAG TPA: CdaR family protein [Candidatus Limnocylindrales bacterium]